MRKIFTLSLAIFGLLTAGTTQAADQSGIVANMENQISVGQTATLSVEVQNNNPFSLDNGYLKVSVPSELKFVSSSPAFTAIDGDQVLIATPQLETGTSFQITASLRGQTERTDITVPLIYEIDGKINVQGSISVDVTGQAAVQGEITENDTGDDAGETTTLPQTGLPAAILLLGALPLLALKKK